VCFENIFKKTYFIKRIRRLILLLDRCVQLFLMLGRNVDRVALQKISCTSKMFKYCQLFTLLKYKM